MQPMSDYLNILSKYLKYLKGVMENNTIRVGAPIPHFQLWIHHPDRKSVRKYCTWTLNQMNLTDIERLLLNHAETPGFLAPGGEEFNPGPEMRLDGSELLCNKVLLKCKGDRGSFWHRHQKGQEEYPRASLSSGVIYSPMNPKNVWRL